MTIGMEVSNRNICEILHFTTNRGLVGTLASEKLLSRRRVREEDYLQHILHNNALVRQEELPNFDKSKDWIDYISLSISEINSSYFGFSGNWAHNKDVWWCIMAFDPAILEHDGVVFVTTNNVYPHCVRQVGLVGFQALFESPVPRKGDWKAFRGARPANLPTCEQAEVLYPGELSTAYLKRIYVRKGEDADRVRGFLRDFVITNVDVVIDEQKFRGVHN